MRQSSAQPLIEVEDLVHIYPNGTEALRGVSLTVHRGEIVGIIGQNGSGKTTLAKHFNGLLKPTRGRVVVGGLDTRRVPVSKLARIVGYVFQNPDHQIFAHTVYEEVAFGPKNLGMDRATIERNVDHALRTLDLAAFRTWHPMRLSRGQRQRLAIAAVLAMRPDVLVLDEPTGGMDREQIARLRAVLDELHASGHTIVLITHDLEVLAALCTRALVLWQGRVLLDGEPRTVFRHEEELRRTFIRPPQVARLSIALGWPRTWLTVEEAVRDLRDDRLTTPAPRAAEGEAVDRS